MPVLQKPELQSSWIDPDAEEIVRRLQRAGFQSYFVGGCVRDVLLGHKPKDFDIATSAKPEEVRRKIPFCYVIGKRFRLVLARRGEKQFEISTFRREIGDGEVSEEESQRGIYNVYGTAEQDALRRDFTINALFFDPITQELLDYAGGLADLKSGWIRIIGNPDERLQEDPIRSLRALRLAHKINFKIEPSLRASIQKFADWLPKMPLPRRREEYLKILRLEEPARALCELFDLGLMQTCLPTLAELWQDDDRRNEFLFSYGQKVFRHQGSAPTPVELVAPLILAWIQSLGSSEGIEKRLDEFLRNEFGFFKTEQVELWQVLEMLPTLNSVPAFAKRGERRQKSFVHNPLFSTAYSLALWSGRLSPQENLFWTKLQHNPLALPK